MKQLHVHVFVKDMDDSTRFYNDLFASQPVLVKPDYARWSLTDPPVNFAISTHGSPGIDHLGIQTDNNEELTELFQRTQMLDAPVDEQGETSCCYARSVKSWVEDPQGISWELLHTLHNEESFHGQQTDPTCCDIQGCGS